MRALVLTLAACLLASEPLERAEAAKPSSGVVVSVGGDQCQLTFDGPLSLVPNQPLRAFRRQQATGADRFVGVLTITRVRDRQATARFAGWTPAVGDVVLVPLFLDDRQLEREASLKEYTRLIAEVEAAIQSFRNGQLDLQGVNATALEADRIAYRIASTSFREKAEEQLTEMKRQVRHANVELERLSQAAKTEQKELARLRDTRADEQRRLDGLRTDLTAARDAFADASALLSTARDQLAKIEKARKSARADIDAIHRLRDDTHASRTRLDSEREAFRRHVDSERKAIAALREELRVNYLGEFRAEWEAMADEERARWLLERLSARRGIAFDDLRPTAK